MSYPADVTPDINDRPARGATLVNQHNNLVADVRFIQTQLKGVLAKLDADAGVTDTNYTALWGVPDASLLAAKVRRN